MTGLTLKRAPIGWNQDDYDVLEGGGIDLINVRFAPLCGLKSDISRGPRSANCGREQMQQTV